MSQIAIDVQAISKRFLLYHQDNRALSVAITQQLKRLLPGHKTAEAKIFWALKDISFQIEKGEIVGLIGNNGSGKSTLLKIIAKVMEATSGSVKVRGSMRALLEVGTGFHYELSGRENIFFNSALLGISKAETKRHLDEIIAFSGVEEYIDIPIKYYSSGMKVRLGFAVATQFQPDILILDEVLTVGDLGFRKKSLARVKEIAAQYGTTTLFVSHNLNAAQELCHKALWLQEGELVGSGAIEEVIEQYERKVVEQMETKKKEMVNSANATGSLQSARQWEASDPEAGNEQVRLHRVFVRNSDQQQESPLILLKQAIEIVVEFSTNNPADRIDLTLQLSNGLEEIFMTSSTAFEESLAPNFQTGRFLVSCTLAPWFLNSGIISIDVLFHKNKMKKAIFRKNKVVAFFATPDSMEFGILHRKTKGAVRPKLDWKIEPIK